MTRVHSLIAFLLLTTLTGCFGEKKYGTEEMLFLPGKVKAVWAVAPAINLSGQDHVDALLQADLVYAQLSQVHGVKAIPVNRVVQVFVALKIDQIETPEQAALVCDLLGADAIVIPTVTIYDPYDPPKFGASLQLMAKPGSFTREQNIDARELARAAKADPNASPEVIDNADFIQSVGVFDSSNGSVRQMVLEYADGRHDPVGPMGADEYFRSMDRYCSFVYFTLIDDLLHSPKLRR